MEGRLTDIKKLLTATARKFVDLWGTPSPSPHVTITESYLQDLPNLNEAKKFQGGINKWLRTSCPAGERLTMFSTLPSSTRSKMQLINLQTNMVQRRIQKVRQKCSGNVPNPQIWERLGRAAALVQKFMGYGLDHFKRTEIFGVLAALFAIVPLSRCLKTCIRTTNSMQCCSAGSTRSSPPTPSKKCSRPSSQSDQRILQERWGFLQPCRAASQE